MALNTDHIKWFRDSSPYIDAHRDKTFVVCIASDALQSENFPNVICDIALLDSLGAKVVVVFGGDHKVKAVLEANGSNWLQAGGRRITNAIQIETVTSVLGQMYADLSARFSASTPESPAKRRAITTSTGNFIRAKPLGIKNGVDHQLSGLVRNINEAAIRHQLSDGSIVLIPSIGYSPSGETFHLDVDVVAREVACALTADKLIFMTEQAGLKDIIGNLISEIDLSDTRTGDVSLEPLPEKLLDHCDQACRKGVARCHIISFATDGALLEELFTRDGCGTQIIGNSYEQIRTASIEDVPGILKLIAPLEESGGLVKRSRELLESEIQQFVVIERDGLLISCAALYRYDTSGELACLVTHPDYRNSDRGDRLLDAIEKTARASQLVDLFVLTTQSAHWFTERGFSESSREALPEGKKEFYNYQRSSTVLRKALRD
jgi:amino-acid N-acetyltransferase|tara:strand:+ start:2500 stop:3804 length:1305 start_codon:yes stop_codon:yes gene_type:complete